MQSLSNEGHPCQQHTNDNNSYSYIPILILLPTKIFELNDILNTRFCIPIIFDTDFDVLVHFNISTSNNVDMCLEAMH